MPDTSSSSVPSSQVKQAELETVRTWLNARPDVLLAVAKRHTSNPLLSSTTSTQPTFSLSVPYGGLTPDKLRIKVSTNARNVEVDIPLPIPSSAVAGLGKGGFGKRVEQLGWDALKHFDVPRHPRITTFLPPRLPSTFVLPPLALLLFLLLASSTNTYANIGRELVHRFLGKWVIPGAALFAGFCHLLLEPAIIYGRLRKHSVPFMPSFLYLFTVVMIGYGGIEALDRAVIQERMRLVQEHSHETKKGQ
ncbi:hypothetical protein IAU60_000661 [Kwoniella sp. DSM 27419]